MHLIIPITEASTVHTAADTHHESSKQRCQTFFHCSTGASSDDEDENFQVSKGDGSPIECEWGCSESTAGLIPDHDILPYCAYPSVQPDSVTHIIVKDTTHQTQHNSTPRVRTRFVGRLRSLVDKHGSPKQTMNSFFTPSGEGSPWRLATFVTVSSDNDPTFDYSLSGQHEDGVSVYRRWNRSCTSSSFSMGVFK